MRIQCDCGAFTAELTGFPRNSPGRLVCYCDDCQAYLTRLGRPELLDAHGGTEVLPVYPSEVVILSGADQLRCARLRSDGLFRWSVTCCNSPIVNTPLDVPWAGVFASAFTAADPANPAALGGINARIMGAFAQGEPPFRIARKIGPTEMFAVLPFVAKGKLLGKSKGSPFFEADGKTPIREPALLPESQRIQD